LDEKLTVAQLAQRAMMSERHFARVFQQEVGLSTQEFIMRSPGPLLTPLLGAGLITAAVAVAHAAMRRRIERNTAAAPWRLRRFRLFARACAGFGWIALGAGGLLVVGFAALAPLVPLYTLVTPVLLAVGAGSAAYAVRLGRLLGHPPRHTVALALYAVLTTSLLWATATLAQYAGQGAAIALGELRDRPAVVLDTKERLFLTTPAVQERALPPGEAQAFRYRYRNLRLLIQGEDRLFIPYPGHRPRAPGLLSRCSWRAAGPLDRLRNGRREACRPPRPESPPRRLRKQRRSKTPAAWAAHRGEPAAVAEEVLRPPASSGPWPFLSARELSCRRKD